MLVLFPREKFVCPWFHGSSLYLDAHVTPVLFLFAYIQLEITRRYVKFHIHRYIYVCIRDVHDSASRHSIKFFRPEYHGDAAEWTDEWAIRVYTVRPVLIRTTSVVTDAPVRHERKEEPLLSRIVCSYSWTGSFFSVSSSFTGFSLLQKEEN